MSSPPIVTVVIPCFNQGRFLAQAIDSVRKQSLAEWECIIINDGSTDNTEEIATRLAQTEHRIRYIFQENRGLAATRNAAIAQSCADYILPLDADDWIGPTYLEAATAVLRQRPEVGIVYGGAERFGAKSGPWRLPAFALSKCLLANCIFCSAFFRRADFELVGGYDTNLVHGLEDWDFWLSLLERGRQVVKLDGTHFHYRIKADSMIVSLHQNKGVERETTEYIIRKHFRLYCEVLGSPVTLASRVRDLEAALKQIKASRIYRLGRALTAPYRTIKTLMR